MVSKYQKCIRRVEILIADELVIDLRCARDGLNPLVDEMFTAYLEYTGLLSAEEKEKKRVSYI